MSAVKLLDTQVHTGISESARHAVAEALKEVLADTYALYLKTQNYHWNVRGPAFPSLHGLFEEQYSELAEASDELAERIRALGFDAPGSFREFTQLTQLPEAHGKPPEAKRMVADLLEGQETVARQCRTLAEQANEAGDLATADLLTTRIAAHEKCAWKLRSLFS